MKNWTNIIFLAAIFSFDACNQPHKGEPDYEGLAKAVCLCNENLEQLNKKFEVASQLEDSADAEKILTQIENSEAEFQSCLERAESKYGIIKGEENETKINAALKIHCPALLEIPKEPEDLSAPK